jgi:uncharacterized damage-inducible protein DinB
MRAIRSLPAALALPLLLVASQASAQQEPTLVADLLGDLGELETKLVGLAEAMPESSYGWRPMEGVRSTGEVFKHLASDNFLLAAAGGLAAPEATGIDGSDYTTAVAYEKRAMDKSEVVAAVRASFDHLEAAIASTSAARLGEKVDLFGRPATVQSLWLLTVTHAHEHLGQAIAYARANEVVPPWSR